MLANKKSPTRNGYLAGLEVEKEYRARNTTTLIASQSCCEWPVRHLDWHSIISGVYDNAITALFDVLPSI